MSGSENPTGHFGSNLSWILSFSLYGITMGHPHYICIMGCIFIQSIAVGVCVPSIFYWDWDVCLPFCVFANKHLSPECVTAAWIKTAPMQKFHMIHSISGRARATLTPQHIPLASFRSLTETIRDKSKKEKKTNKFIICLRMAFERHWATVPHGHCSEWRTHHCHAAPPSTFIINQCHLCALAHFMQFNGEKVSVTDASFAFPSLCIYIYVSLPLFVARLLPGWSIAMTNQHCAASSMSCGERPNSHLHIICFGIIDHSVKSAIAQKAAPNSGCLSSVHSIKKLQRNKTQNTLARKPWHK